VLLLEIIQDQTWDYSHKSLIIPRTAPHPQLEKLDARSNLKSMCIDEDLVSCSYLALNDSSSVHCVVCYCQAHAPAVLVNGFSGLSHVPQSLQDLKHNDVIFYKILSKCGHVRNH
jgi:hypothetical protein